MKVLGLIMEANPFHTGHKYFIEKAKELVKPDYVVCLMSGNFTMRGEVSIINKWDKAEIALKLGCDLVLDFPSFLSVNSRDDFSFNAVYLLNKAKITHLAFGIETSDINKLKDYAKIELSPTFQELIKEYLDEGLNYKLSARRVMERLLKESSEEYALPNNTLGIGYIKACEKINKKINLVPIHRLSSQHFFLHLSDIHSSSTAIRNEINKGTIPFDFLIDDSISYLSEKILNEKLYQIFQYQITLLDAKGLRDIKGVNDGLENRIIKASNEPDYKSFLDTCESKRYPKNYLKRVIINILGNVKKENSFSNDFFRITSMNEKGKKLIGLFKKEHKDELFYSFKEHKTKEVEHELNMTKLYGIITNNPKIYLKEYNIKEDK